jgi:hypothetical protein
MSEATPTLEIRQRGQPMCLLRLDLGGLTREGEVLLAGDQACLPEVAARS